MSIAHPFLSFFVSTHLKYSAVPKTTANTRGNLPPAPSVIIFSKSYCPYSKRAKALLLEKYTIDPAPYVVELDEHPLGPALQDYLGDKTHRHTVPNILINGVSIGGADDVTELDKRHKLTKKFKQLGHGKVQIKDSSEGA